MNFNEDPEYEDFPIDDIDLDEIVDDVLEEDDDDYYK